LGCKVINIILQSTITIILALVVYTHPSDYGTWLCLGICLGIFFCSIIDHIFHKKEMKELDKLLEVLNGTQEKQ
jgi:hypothetical protein